MPSDGYGSDPTHLITRLRSTYVGRDGAIAIFSLKKFF